MDFMPRLLERYIARTVMLTIILVVLLVVGIDALFAFVRELKHIAPTGYTGLKALLYTLMTLPRRLYTLFPMAGMLGALMGLGLLVSRSELIVMRSVGVSYWRIAASVMLVAFILAFILALLGEFVLPRSEQFAEVFKATAKGEGQAMFTAKGIWLRDAGHFIHIDAVHPEGRMTGVTRYVFSPDNTMQSASYAKEARFNGKQWILFDVVASEFSEQGVTATKIDRINWDSHVSPDLFTILIRDPSDLSMRGLYRYNRYLKRNNITNKQTQLAFWKKAFQPLATVVMVFLAIPFVFGPLRSTAMGLRLLVGIGCGFAFYLLNELFGPISLVYHFPPVLAAIGPSVLVGLLGFVLFRRSTRHY